MKKLIAIEDNNKNIIEDMIHDVEGNRVKERKLTYKDMIYAVDQVEKRLNLPKKYLNGIQVNVDIYAARFPNCYKGTPQSTQFMMIYKSGKWKIDNIYRADCGYNPDKKFIVKLTEDAKQEIINRRLKEVVSF